MQPKYKRVLLKLSGEALAGDQKFGLNHDVIAPVVDQIVQIHNMGVEVGLVIGGGNFWRGRQGTNMDRTTADHMGMLATVMNSLAMMDAIEQRGVPVRVQTALDMVSLAEPFILRKALRHFEMGRIVIFACGTGNPYCSTDTAAALRACEIDADICAFLCANASLLWGDFQEPLSQKGFLKLLSFPGSFRQRRKNFARSKEILKKEKQSLL